MPKKQHKSSSTDDGSTDSVCEIVEVVKQSLEIGHTSGPWNGGGGRGGGGGGGNNYHRPRNTDCSTAYKFQSILTPAKLVRPCHSHTEGVVEFVMRRKNMVVTFQWEPFNLILSANTSCVVVCQGINNLPCYSLRFLISLEICGHPHMGYLEISPNFEQQVRFYLSTDGLQARFNRDDDIFIPGSSVSWITY